MSVDPVGAILQHHGIRDRWTPLPATGVAPALLGDAPEARILAQQLWRGLEDLRDSGRLTRDPGELRAFVALHRGVL